LINEAVEEQRWGKPERTEWLYVDLVFYMPDRKIRDSHNCLKILLDVLQGTVFVNDYFCLPRIQSVEYDKENPRVEVLITHQTKTQREKGIKTTTSVL
jgi:Holliday junction resolvase RusA-like endonuclease